MKKKQKSQKMKSSRVTSGSSKVQYFYGIFAVFAVSAITIGFLQPVQNQQVLGESHRNAEARGGPGNVQMGENNDDDSSETNIRIETNPGKETERDGKGEKRKEVERRAMRARDTNRDKQKVTSESGEEIKIKKDRKAGILVLPNQAVEALLKNGFLTQIGSSSAVGSDAAVVYKTVNGKPVYVVAGVSEKKVFGFIPVEVKKSVTVSAEDGTVKETNMSLLNRILTSLSF